MEGKRKVGGVSYATLMLPFGFPLKREGCQLIPVSYLDLVIPGTGGEGKSVCKAKNSIPGKWRCLFRLV